MGIAVASIAVAASLAGCAGDEPEEPVATLTVTETAVPDDEAVADGAVPEDEGIEVKGDAFGGEDIAVPEPPWDPGTFEAYAPSGGHLLMQIPAEEVPKDLEAARKMMEVDPVVYISVDVDNREGQNFVNMYEVNLFDPVGKKYTFSGADTAVDEWFYDVGTETNGELDLYNEGIELANSYRDGVDVSQRDTMILVGEEVPDQIADVQVYAEGAFEVSFAFPVDR